MDKIFTIQPKGVYDILVNTGVYNSRKELCDTLKDMDDTTNQWQHAYSWMREKLVKKTGIAPPEDIYPIWGWLPTADSPMPKDLRLSFYKNWSSVRQEFVVIELLLPTEDHLPSEFSAWHYALNGWFLSNDEQIALFEKECAERGLNLFSGECLNLPLDVQEKIKQSWDACLDIHQLDSLEGMSPYSWQTVFWEIKLKNIVSVRKFVTKGKKHEHY